jgi:hypothetical protein
MGHRTVSGAPYPYKIEPSTLGKTNARSAIIHRTVRCAIGLSGELAGNGYLRATVDSDSSEREMCPWAISISVLVIRCPTHIDRVLMS